ncbi:MAG: hypothetical protein J0H17_15040 [Rhizobiales bacterium]|nr:hypothetical protein [Hyphomicrobiales bacterium]
MTKMIFAVVLLALGASTALAPTASAQSTPEQERACKSDATRHCRKVMKDGDDAILQCLKSVREKLSNQCRKVLEDSGN